jgi:hypothetical protein
MTCATPEGRLGLGRQRSRRRATGVGRTWVSVSATAPFRSSPPEAAQLPRRQPSLRLLLAVWIDAIWAHAGPVAAFAHLSLRPATKIANTGHPRRAGFRRDQGGAVAMLAGSFAGDAGV